MNEATPITLAELDERLAELETLEDFPRIQAAETVGVDLLSALLDEIKILQQPWQSMPERQQTELIDRLRQRIKDNVQRAVALIAAENRVTVVATLEEVKFKGGIEAKLKLSKANVHRLDLADNVGEEVLVCIMPAEQFTGGMDDVRGDADQPDLLETDAEEDFDPDSDTLYQHGVRYLRSGECRPSISSIQRILKIGYNRAARMLERMEAEQVVTPVQTDGSRELLF